MGMVMTVIAIGSCTRKIYVPIERTEVRRDSMIMRNHISDSIYMSDSVSTWWHGDTVIIKESKMRFRDRVIRDTVIRMERDSIPVPVKIPAIESERHSGIGKWRNKVYGLLPVVLLITGLVMMAVRWLRPKG